MLRPAQCLSIFSRKSIIYYLFFTSIHLEKSHTSTTARKIFMLIKNETCVICHPIFFQFISSSKMTINFSLLWKIREKSTQETLFCVISFNLIQCIKSEDQYTPFPNKFKTLFHSQNFSASFWTFFFLFFILLFYFRGRSKKCNSWQKKKNRIVLPDGQQTIVCDLDAHKRRMSLKNKVQVPEKPA